MDLLFTLGRTFGFSLAAGVNLYATVAILGLATRFGWVELPAQFRLFDNDWVIGFALLLYGIEFVADKIPWVDTLWDAVHTVVRPLGGALLAVSTLGDTSPGLEAVVALAGGALAAGGHFTKAGTRVAANASPEPFSNWILSLAEDVFAVTLGVVSLQYPLLALGVVAIAAVVMLLLASWIWRLLRRRRPAAGGPAMAARPSSV